MSEWIKNENLIDYTELYRQNYEDALDEIRNLKFKIAELENENRQLRRGGIGNYILDWHSYLYKNK